MIDPNAININIAVATIYGAWFIGWAIGMILWIVRYFLIELPRTGSIFKRGGEII
jgi:hypothetical protein